MGKSAFLRKNDVNYALRRKLSDEFMSLIIYVGRLICGALAFPIAGRYGCVYMWWALTGFTVKWSTSRNKRGHDLTDDFYELKNSCPCQFVIVRNNLCGESGIQCLYCARCAPVWIYGMREKTHPNRIGEKLFSSNFITKRLIPDYILVHLLVQERPTGAQLPGTFRKCNANKCYFRMIIWVCVPLKVDLTAHSVGGL